MGNCCSRNQAVSRESLSNQPLNSPVAEEAETMNVLSSSSEQSTSPVLMKSSDPLKPENLSIDLSRISSDENDELVLRPTEGSEEPKSIRPFAPASNKSSGKRSSTEAVTPSAVEEPISEPLSPLSEADQNELRGPNETFDNSRDDIELNEQVFDESQVDPYSVSPRGDEEPVKYFSQRSLSQRSTQSSNSEHESSKLNHFKKLGRATLVTDGSSSLLTRGGRLGGKNRKTAVAMAAHAENQRDSYGQNSLSKEELKMLASAAKSPAPALEKIHEGNEKGGSRDQADEPAQTETTTNNET